MRMPFLGFHGLLVHFFFKLNLFNFQLFLEGLSLFFIESFLIRRYFSVEDVSEYINLVVKSLETLRKLGMLALNVSQINSVPDIFGQSPVCIIFPISRIFTIFFLISFLTVRIRLIHEVELVGVLLSIKVREELQDFIRLRVLLG